jgi:ubiquinone/menaquinone biosynthesis C-methylase UbiE
MPKLRAGRRIYYNIFSRFYDLFIKLHSRNYGAETRRFLADSAQLENKISDKVLDICCGTGSVILSFAERFSDILAIGYDFSHGMLLKAYEKDLSNRLVLIEGDAAILPFKDDLFDVVCCSHALYELKGPVRKEALLEMRRVVKSNGRVLIMEHEVPRKSFIKMLFYLRMLMMGPKDSREFLKQGISPFKKIFSDVTLSHTESGKSKLFICRQAKGSCSEA